MSNKSVPKIAAIYDRVAVNKLVGGNSKSESHLAEIHEKLKADGVQVPEKRIYKDIGSSGATLVRPDLNRMVADGQLGKFNVLYVYDRATLSRKLIHQEILLGELRKVGVKVIFIHGVGDISPEERVMGSITGLLQEYARIKEEERKRLEQTNFIQRIKIGLLERRRRKNGKRDDS